ncbi:MAG: hypothetical protein IPN71_13085 [Fibrobacteres bacterium]|nr:hypothetical protein [Fibrobacterota bacterium]
MLRRTLFGHGKSGTGPAVALGMTGTVDALLDLPAAPPDPPVVTSATETTIPVGSTWVDQPFVGERAYGTIPATCRPGGWGCSCTRICPSARR